MMTTGRVPDRERIGADEAASADFRPPANLERSPGVPEFELNGTFLGGDLSTVLRLQADRPPGPGAEMLELILDESAMLLPFHFLRTGDRLGRAVVKLLRADGAAGTGFLVAPGILLTNHHVLPDSAAAALAVALANFEAAPPGSAPGRPASVPLDPDSLFVTNAELDFTFCGVRGLDFLGSIALDRSSRNVAAAETVNIIQHPRGRPKEVALRDNRVVKVDGVVVHYECSTEPGSSGSPVFNNRWEPVALHHASVKADGPDAKPVDDPLADPSSRYLNEGIRISAIALWLETDEADAPEMRDQVARLRAIIGGIDARAGFFGALGRKSRGREAPEVVVECYREETDDLDLAFWNIRGMERGTREQLVEVARIIADMRFDLWCLAHADYDYVSSLREHLDSYFGLDYGLLHEPAGALPGLALLYRRTKALAVERRAWGVEFAEGVDLPPLITVRASTKRAGPVAFQLVAVGRPTAPEAALTPYAEAIRHAIRRGLGEPDWVIVGESPVVLAPEKLQVLADCDRDLIAAAAGRDGAMALLTDPRSKAARVFVSSNLLPAFGVSETLAVARDRELPLLLRTPDGSRPIALRLSLDSDPRPIIVPQPASATTPIERAAAPMNDDLGTPGPRPDRAAPRQDPRRGAARSLRRSAPIGRTGPIGGRTGPHGPPAAGESLILR